MTPRGRYPGTQPFGDSREDQARFFGRDDEAEQLYLRVLSVPLLVQFGRSGLGKTSLLQAGLFPRLRQKPFLPAMIRLNDANDALTAAVVRSLRDACDAEGLEVVPGDTSSLWQLLATTSIWRGDLLLTPVLVFDQFEEVFTLRDAALRRSVAAELGRIASAPAGSAPPVKIVISLREDYLGALEEFSAAIPGLFHERLRLEAMTEKAARAAITGPARLVASPDEPPYSSPPFEFDPPALAAMVEYLQGSSGVIEPFQLQLLSGHAEAIAARKGTGPVTLTLADFRGTQEFASVLHNFYRGTLDKLSPPAQRRKALALCEEGLLDAAGHRLMLHEGQILADYGVKRQTLATLCQTRLIRTERRLESTFYEISHDRLAESIIAARQGRLPKKLRRALWAGGIAALIVVALLVVWNRSVERQRQAADTARNSAEGLLTFLLGEQFLGEIRDTGRSSMLEAVRTRVAGSGAGGRTPLNQALALRHQGDMKRIENNLPQALEFQRQSLAILQNLGITREVARAHARMAEVLDEQGQITEAERRYELSVSSWERVTATAEGGADDCVELAHAVTGAARMNDAAGRADRATERFHRAVGIASNVLFGGKGPCAAKWQPIAPFPHAGAVAILSEVAFLRPEDGQEAGTAAIAEHALRLQPQSVRARRNGLVTLAARGRARPPADGLKDLSDVLAGFEELGRWDPRNLMWTHDRALAQLGVARAIAYCHLMTNSGCVPAPFLENAEALTLEALTTLHALAVADPTNEELHTDVIAALDMHASVMSAAGNRDEALTRLQEAERTWNSRRRDPADTFALLQFGDVLQQQAHVLTLVGRTAEAAQKLQHAVDIYEPLHRRQPGNIRYLDHLASARRKENALQTRLGNVAGAAAAASEMQRLVAARESVNRPALEKKLSLLRADTNHFSRAVALMKTHNFAEALSELIASESSVREQIVLSPAHFRAYSTTRATYVTMAGQQKLLHDIDSHLGSLAAAMNAAQVAAWLAPDDQREGENLALLDVRNDVAGALIGQMRIAEAIQVLRENVVLAEEMARRRGCVECRWHLGVAKCMYASIENARWGKRDVSVDGLRGGLIHIESASKESKDGRIWRDLGHWRLALATELEEKNAADPEANKQRRLALAAFRQSDQSSPDDDVKAAIVRLETRIGPG